MPWNAKVGIELDHKKGLKKIAGSSPHVRISASPGASAQVLPSLHC